MRVLLVNAFHYLKGGVERTYLDESRWLSAAGHPVAHFAIRHPDNEPSPTAEYFAPAADFTEGGSALAQLSQLPRALWSAPAAAAMKRLLAAWKPDVAHLHAPSRHLTPSILGPLRQAGVPVVMTLHDFKPWCTNRILYAHGQPCERCRGGSHWHAFTTACVQSSRARSAVGAVEAYLHDALRAYASVRRWIAPSRFVYEKARTFGVDDSVLRVLGHGVEPPRSQSPPPPGTPDRFVFFAGRLSAEKGVRLLPGIAAAIAPVPLIVAGDGPMAGWLHARQLGNLRLVGHLPDPALAGLRSRASVVVVPSQFVEHFGYTVAEALLDARPVVAARIGALPELVEHEVTGLLAEPGDDASLAAGVRRALEDPAAPGWGEAGRDRVRRIADPRAHLGELLGIYAEACEEARQTGRGRAPESRR
jgi:glycosyltransferase involved in cell wall biosynthesis